MPVLSVLVLVPVLVAGLLVALPSGRLRALRSLALGAGIVELALALYVFLSYDSNLGGYQLVERYRWLDSLGVSFHLGVDGVSAPLVLLNGIVLFTGVIISWHMKPRPKDFFILFFTLASGVFGTFVALDLFFLFFFYELAVLPMYLLIGVWGSSSDFGTFIRTKEYGALKLTLVLVAGSVLVWVGLLAMYVEAGVGSFDLLDLEAAGMSVGVQRFLFPFFMLGFGVLAGLWPFHTWSPDGHVAAPTAVSMVHAGVLMKLGAYGLLRVGISLLPEGAHAWAPVLIVLGTVNVVYGAMSAMAQKDLKYVVGYSSVSHMGYVLMGLATLTVVGMDGAVLQMFSHGIMTALFFALVGIVYERAHVRDITVFEGLAKRMGLTSAFFVVAGLTSLGLPGLSGFVAEFLVFVGVFQTYPVLGVLAIIGAAITAVYILRLLGKVFFGPLNPKWEKLPDATPREGFAAAVLVATIVFVGVNPGFLMRAIDSGVQALATRL
ncbi:MAG: NADH-quinone oxidoreductase subunit M [Chloroflexi bacterium]|nr:NADH-quinone oxidoreductase subunit M [Chloroflexota bacterium]